MMQKELLVERLILSPSLPLTFTYIQCCLYAQHIHSVHETTMSHRLGGLALCAAAQHGWRTKAALLEKPCRRGSRITFGLCGYDR